MEKYRELLFMLSEDTRDDIGKIKLAHLLISRLHCVKRTRCDSISSVSTLDESTTHQIRNYRCNQAMLKTIQKNHVCNIQADSEEHCQIIYENFIKLYNKHIPYGSVLNNGKPEILAVLVKQFFLDKYLLSDTYYQILLIALKKEKSVDIELFTECVESLQINFFGTFYYYFKSPPSELKELLDNQKLVCKGHLVFFCFINVQKSSLNFIQVCEMFSFAFRKMKKGEVAGKARDLLSRASSNKSVKQTIALFELINILYKSC